MDSQKIYPENIPSEQEMLRFIHNFDNDNYHKSIVYHAIKLSEKIPNVEAAFLFGSLSKGSADIFSDIDFYLMIEDDIDFKDIIASFLLEIDSLGEPIHIFQSNAKKNSTIIYFKPFIKFELVVENYSKLIKEWRLAERASLLFDKRGLGEKAINESKNIKFDIQNYINEIQNVALELPSFCFLISGYMTRGEYITVIDFIAWIRRKLLRISGLLLGIQDEGTRRAEKRFPKELLEYYNNCKVKDKEDVWNCLMVFLEWYSNWMVPKFEEKSIINANQEVNVIKTAIKKVQESF